MNPSSSGEQVSANVPSQAEMRAILEHSSDFSFEVRTARQIRDMGFYLQHSASYIDPVTQKPRQFDIVATKTRQAAKQTLWLAVECKNLRSPLIVHATGRRASESFHQLIVDRDIGEHTSPTPGRGDTILGRRAMYRRPPNTPYIVGGPVGKAMDQIVRGSKKGEFKLSDSDIFEKMSQALSSAQYLASTSVIPEKSELGSQHAILPVVVVPEGQLWVASYNDSGVLVSGPDLKDHISYFVARTWDFQAEMGEFYVSHIEVVTPDGLSSMLKRYWVETDEDDCLLFAEPGELDPFKSR